MLSNQTQVEFIRVEEKRFRVVPVTFPGESNKYSPAKLNQDVDLRDDNDEDLGGWINCAGGVPAKEDPAIFLEAKEEEKDDPELKKFTHFLSAPFNLKSFLDPMRKLHLEISKSYGDKFKECLNKPEKSHLTMLMLKLDTEEKIKRLGELQDEINKTIKNIVGNQELVLEPGNLETFHQVNKKTGEKSIRVVYVSLKENKGLKALREIVHVVTSLLLREKVIFKEDFSHMKLNEVTKKYEVAQMHITLLKNPDNKLKSADIEKMVQDFKKFGWKDVALDRIDISYMGTYEENGFYKPLHRFNFK